MRRPRILRVIHPMSEAWNLLLLREQSLYVFDRIGSILIDIHQNLEHRLVGAPVQRPFQRANRRSHCRVHIGQSRRSHARRECRSIQFVVSMQNERDVKGPLGRCGWSGAIQHVQEIRCVRHRTIRLDDLLSLPHPVVIRHQHRDLCGQPDRLVHVRFMIVAIKFRIVIRKHRHQRAQHIHRKYVLREQFQAIQDRGIQLAFFGESLLERPQFLRTRQASKPQQVTDFLKRRVIGEIVDIDSAIGQYTLFSIDITDAGGGRDHPFQPLGRVRCADA